MRVEPLLAGELGLELRAAALVEELGHQGEVRLKEAQRLHQSFIWNVLQRSDVCNQEITIEFAKIYTINSIRQNNKVEKRAAPSKTDPSPPQSIFRGGCSLCSCAS